MGLWWKEYGGNQFEYHPTDHDGTEIRDGEIIAGSHDKDERDVGKDCGEHVQRCFSWFSSLPSGGP